MYALAQGGPARDARPRRPVRRRRRGEAGRRGDLPPRARARRRGDPGRHRRDRAPRSRTCSRTRARSSSPPARSRSPAPRPTSSGTGLQGQDAGRDRLRRQHELRPPALRRRARRARRAARGDARGHDPGAPGQLQDASARCSARATSPSSTTATPIRSEAHVFVGVQVRDRDETGRSCARLARTGCSALDLTDNELAKLHVRHLVGGHAPRRTRRDALPLRVPRAARRADEVPRRDEPRLEHQPVPLPQPRRRLRPRAGRHAGAAEGNAGSFAAFLEELGYPYADETRNPAYRLFLGDHPCDSCRGSDMKRDDAGVKVLDKPVDGKKAWVRADLKEEDWLFRLTPECLAEVRAAAEHSGRPRARSTRSSCRNTPCPPAASSWTTCARCSTTACASRSSTGCRWTSSPTTWARRSTGSSRRCSRARSSRSSPAR